MPADELITTRPPPDSDGWSQVTIEFPDWSTGEAAAVRHLRPLLHDDLGIADWRYVRKRPCWRVRYRPVRGDTDRLLAAALDALVAAGALSRWNHAVYEPERLAFGGPDGMDVAHRLFHEDSAAILDRAPPDGPARREPAVVTVTVLLRAAGLDWYEQGDVWAAVADHRRVRTPVAPPAATAPAAMRHLLTLDISEQRPLGTWTDAFAKAGSRLEALAHVGRLRRGLRAVLTHHVIFHWNRLGLPYPDQRALAVLARDVIMGAPADQAS